MRSLDDFEEIMMIEGFTRVEDEPTKYRILHPDIESWAMEAADGDRLTIRVINLNHV